MNRDSVTEVGGPGQTDDEVHAVEENQSRLEELEGVELFGAEEESKDWALRQARW